MLCPITTRQVDEKAARLVALSVVLLVPAALALGGVAGAALLAALLADFAVRGVGVPRWSPLAGGAGRLLRALAARPAPTNAGPKMFAARLGAAATAATLGALLLGAPGAAWALGGALASLAALEAAAGFCVGCRLYTLLLPVVTRRGSVGGAAGSRA
jgi:hypothetical protein